VKTAGEEMAGEGIDLMAHRYSSEQMLPYERLLGDAMRGDPSLFAREDSVESAWRVLDPILGAASNVYQYEPGTWGPSEANQIIAGQDVWQNPVEGTEA
jgi:glucose-6-phosphate 1-dehydrogenase